MSITSVASNRDKWAISEMGGATWHLRVTRVYPQVTDGTFTLDLTFTGSEPPGLLPGQNLQGKLTLGADQTGTIVPAGAFLERTGGDWIFVLTRDGSSARRRFIKIGRRNAEQVEVLNGLAAWRASYHFRLYRAGPDRIG